MLRTEGEIIASWGDSVGEVKVSICCITYNHADFIESAIQGFLIQKTNFPIEIIIHDDASDDGTVPILEFYKAQYPKIIRLVLNSKNRYSQGRRGFLFDLMLNSRAPYIATCEGDDFWTDENKLQKQFEFLEKNKNYVMATCKAIVKCEGNNEGDFSRMFNKIERNFSQRSLVRGDAWVLTVNRFFRNCINELVYEATIADNNDVFLTSFLGQFGHCYFDHSIKPSVYRIHDGGVWSLSNEREKKIKIASTMQVLALYYYRVKRYELSEHFQTRATIENLRNINKIKLIRGLVLLSIRLIKRKLKWSRFR